MAETTPAGGPRRDGRAPDTRRPAPRPRLPASLASAGRWAGERQRQRGWEDHLAEFLAAILTWGGIGWLVDRWLGTDPGFLIGGIVLGNSLGLYLLWIRSNTDGAQTPPRASSTVDQDTDDTGGRAA